MKRKVILVDVDVTVVDTATSWADWYTTLTNHDIFEDLKGYSKNICDIMHSHHDPMEYWRKHDLYDTLEPFPNSVAVLTRLSERFDIVFVSHCQPEHQRSKEYFLKRFFKFDYGFVSTGQKELVYCDYAIDDYHRYLQNIMKKQPDVTPIMHKTMLNVNDEEFVRMDWIEIEEFMEVEV